MIRALMASVCVLDVPLLRDSLMRQRSCRSAIFLPDLVRVVRDRGVGGSTRSTNPLWKAMGHHGMQKNASGFGFLDASRAGKLSGRKISGSRKRPSKPTLKPGPKAVHAALKRRCIPS